jgi:hypothetical protein
MKQILIGKKKNLIFSLKLAFMSATLLATSLGSSFAATGDILYQNCTTSGNCTGAGSNNGWTRTVVSSGCHSGQCLKLVGTVNTNSGAPGYGAGNTSIGVPGVSGHDEITVQYWVKYDENARSMSGGNLKNFIPYISSTTRWGTVIAPHVGRDFRLSHITGTFKSVPWFTPVTTDTNRAYSTDNGDGTYYSGGGYTMGDITLPQKPGTTWVKYTVYLKLPTTLTGTNGIAKVWYNDQVMFDMRNCSIKESGGTTKFTRLTFYSSSEAKEPFEHWMDDMIVYEGYVPPSGAPAPAPAPAPIENIVPLAPEGFQAAQ